MAVRVWVNPFVDNRGRSVRGHWRVIKGSNMSVRVRAPKGSRAVSSRPGVHAPFGQGRGKR